jgi:CheY-like chemotaxis protein
MTTKRPDDRPVTPLAEVAHELRSPLGGVEAMARLLSETTLTDEQRRLVDALCAASAHLRAIANDVLDGGGEVKAPSIEEHPVDLPAFLTMFATAAEARARAKGLSFSVRIDDVIAPVILADGRRLRQMLENLIDNAMKVTEAGRVELAIERLDRRGGFEAIRFAVTDTGPGLTAEEAGQLFRAYNRLANSVAGTGLGLSMVRRLARAMGGEAGCDSEPGRGATFWFTLRLKQAAATRGPGRILVVDDNHANRLIMGAVLEHFGHAMVEAASAEEALELLPSGAFAAVLLDHTLPGLSGLEALKLIRTMPDPLGSLPVIPVTGRVSGADREAFAAAGANGFVEKPVTARALKEALDNVLMDTMARVA